MLCLPAAEAWSATRMAMVAAGFVDFASFNSCGARRGRRFAGPEGYRE